MCSSFSNTTTATIIYTLSLHDALPIYAEPAPAVPEHGVRLDQRADEPLDRKSTRLNSSHTVISYAVFCLKKKTRALTNTAWYPSANSRALSPPLPLAPSMRPHLAASYL